MKIKGLAAILLSTVAVTAVSAVALAASGYPTGTPSGVWVGFTDDSTLVMGLSNTAGCARSEIKFSSAWTDADKVATVANAAFLSGKKLICYVNGCAGDFQKGFDCRLTN